MPVATPQQLTTLNETSFIGDSTLEGNYPQSKKLGLRRKLSKVKSLVDMRSALLAEHRKSSPRRSDVNVDESSFRANSPRSLKETRHPLTVMEEQETNESTFSSFIKRTMSSDSLMRKTSKKGARSLSPEVTLTPATLTSTAGNTICPIPDEAMDSSRKVENTVELAPSGTAPAEVHAEEKTKRSAQSSGSFSHHIHTILPDKLPDITEETENKSVDMSRDHSMVSIQVQVLNHSEQVERATRSTTEDKKSKGDSRAQDLSTSDRVQRDKLPSA
ncbi:hypothetical protein QFC19_001884 [Naganishia cerealis]|uniref:Uncharacterized protein n=1 Tax=Naganishia cerealis TaxID=610337 RepID=A0ACC2WFD9_9TREE|nr:hypothetical protein QFC19_001884 [Naganishia cerealis]